MTKDEGLIAMPKNAVEAEAMEKIAYAWLKEHAPEILKQSAQMYQQMPDGTLKALNVFAPSWQGLSDNEITRLVLINEVDKSGDTGFAKLIEQALREKNYR